MFVIARRAGVGCRHATQRVTARATTTPTATATRRLMSQLPRTASAGHATLGTHTLLGGGGTVGCGGGGAGGANWSWSWPAVGAVGVAALVGAAQVIHRVSTVYEGVPWYGMVGVYERMQWCGRGTVRQRCTGNAMMQFAWTSQCVVSQGSWYSMVDVYKGVQWYGLVEVYEGVRSVKVWWMVWYGRRCGGACIVWYGMVW